MRFMPLSRNALFKYESDIAFNTGKFYENRCNINFPDS